jgi:hypothetical protein
MSFTGSRWVSFQLPLTQGQIVCSNAWLAPGEIEQSARRSIGGVDRSSVSRVARAVGGCHDLQGRETPPNARQPSHSHPARECHRCRQPAVVLKVGERPFSVRTVPLLLRRSHSPSGWSCPANRAVTTRFCCGRPRLSKGDALGRRPAALPARSRSTLALTSVFKPFVEPTDVGGGWPVQALPDTVVQNRHRRHGARR